MVQYPGAFRASIRYLLNSLSSTVLAFIGVGFWSIPALLIGFSAGGRYATFAFLAWVGWGVLIGQGTLDTNDSNDFEDKSTKEKFLAGIFALSYFSAVTFISIVFGSVAVTFGYPAAATGIAFLYPAYDIFMGKKTIPLSALGIIVMGATFINALHALTQLAAEGLQLPGRFVRRGPGRIMG
ncbi:hypothetical protein [Halorussus ruber]|uniref:hypothetical protein n=1 Tax=Halorussus ruber TaxID=1126238 RepID=UPI0010925169|nr:hypothetical protein [Halorussus ruber]